MNTGRSTVKLSSHGRMLRWFEWRSRPVPVAQLAGEEQLVSATLCGWGLLRERHRNGKTYYELSNRGRFVCSMFEED